MARLVAAALALALLSTAGGAAAKDSWGWGRADPWQGLDSNGHAQTCKHFANRARFRNRGLTPEHAAKLAEAWGVRLFVLGHQFVEAGLETWREAIWVIERHPGGPTGRIDR